jgi:hypothetical protein
MRTFCTIITGNYFPYAAVLYKSLIQFNPDEILHILICDDGPLEINSSEYPNIKLHRISDIYHVYKTDVIVQKYGDGQLDALRWSLKPVYISYLLEKGFEKVIFADCDLYFFNNYEFLIAELDKHILLLTPGRTTANPFVHEEEFLSGFKYGLFNAGFIGAGKKSIPVLRWWTDCCSYKIETNFENGLFVDQKYLDALPVLFDNIGIIRHRGCNIAFWNQHECKRVLKNGEVFINGEYPIVFIHFTNKYIPEILAGNDPLLLPYFRDYEKIFKQSGYDLNEFIPGMPEYKEPSVLIKLKRKLLIRTRIKRWLFKLSRDL